MFKYSDPTGAGILAEVGALETYRRLVDRAYDQAAREPASAFTWLEAIEAAVDRESATVSWLAFPLTANAADRAIDDRRFLLQDEYVEWQVARNEAGLVETVTFTTEFTEWYEALASVSFDALVAGVRSVVKDSQPTIQDLLGADVKVDPASLGARERARRFVKNLPLNPWNNGSRGPLCLTHRSNTMGALFGLVQECAKVRSDVAAGDVCAAVGGACVPGRASDPFVCTAAQETVRAGRALSLADPAAIRLLELTGIWELEGQEIEINDSGRNQEIWEVTRAGLRGVLRVSEGLRVAGQPITSGAQVARHLRVGASLTTVAERRLPLWAQTGNESLGRGGES